MHAVFPELSETEKASKKQKWSLTSLEVTDISAIRYATYDFLLVFHWNYACILHRFGYIITYFPKFRGHVTLNTSLSEVIYHACTSTALYQTTHEIWIA